MISVASSYLRSGLCVLPAIVAQKRPSLRGWKQYQARLPTDAEVANWFANADAMCLICGMVSGNLEMIDFDFEAELFGPWCERIQAKMPAILDRLVIERSQSGGKHVVYRCESPISSNLKLAQRVITTADDWEITIGKKRHKPRRAGDHYEIALTLIETRGEGGLFLCAPTSGYVLEHGDFANLPVLTKAERDFLIQTAQTLDESAPRPATPTTCESADNSLTPARSEPSTTCDSESDTSRTDAFETSGRPGDEYNSRGDVRTLLERHGWRCVLGGDNEHWRRPGKDSGWSATLKDRVFYVFSSNAAPFEPNRGYSPFAVYALLEHHGDFEEAARTLRREGFGDDATASDDVDLSKLLVCDDNEERSESSDDQLQDPGRIPETFFHIPGFVARVMDFTLAKAPYPNIGLAFCGAMALQSFLCARQVCTPSDLRPNLYLLALAGSGSGKDFPRKVNARVLFEIGEIRGLGDKFASGEGIQDALLRSCVMLFQNDEMDGVLRQINLDRESRRESIPNILLTLYTSANDVYPLRVKAGQKEAIHIDQPHVTLFGTATPEYFYESLSLRMLTNGFFARLIIVDIGRRGVGQVGGSARRLPEEILAEARWWTEFKPGRQRGNLLSVHPEPRVVSLDSEATEAFAQLRRQTEAEYDAADELKDEVGRSAWSRTCEHAGKLALIYACSENHEKPIIHLAAIEWAAKFAMHQTRRQLYLAKSYMAANEFDSYCKQAIRYLTRCRDSEKDYPVPDWLLRRRLALSPVMHNSVIEALVKQERIQWTTEPTKTKPRTGWALR